MTNKDPHQDRLPQSPTRAEASADPPGVPTPSHFPRPIISYTGLGERATEKDASFEEQLPPARGCSKAPSPQSQKQKKPLAWLQQSYSPRTVKNRDQSQRKGVYPEPKTKVRQQEELPEELGWHIPQSDGTSRHSAQQGQPPHLLFVTYDLMKSHSTEQRL